MVDKFIWMQKVPRGPVGWSLYRAGVGGHCFFFPIGQARTGIYIAASGMCVTGV